MHTKAQQLRTERADILRAGRKMCEEMIAVKRDMTPAEDKILKDGLERVDAIDAELAAMKKGDELMGRLEGLGGSKSGAGDRSHLEPEAVLAAKSKLGAAIESKSPVQVRIPRKSFSTGGFGVGMPSVGTGTVGATPGTAATALRDLFPIEQTNAPAVRWYEVGSMSGADVVGEGELKPEMTSDVTAHDGPLVKIAGRVVMTTEMIDDAEFVVAQIGAQALFAMTRRENQLVLEKMGAASGVMTEAGTLTTALDTIAAAIGAQENVNGLAPERIIMNPADLATIRAAKTTGSGAYVVDPLSEGVPSLYGVPVLSTPALASGTAWLARSEAGTFFERQGVTMTSMPSGDDFDHNRLTVIYEERVLPVVTQPGLLTKITLAAE